MKKLDEYGRGRESVIKELLKYADVEIKKLFVDKGKVDKKDIKSVAKHNLIMGHSRQLMKVKTLLNVKLKNLKEV
jgi:hypothetical protein